MTTAGDRLAVVIVTLVSFCLAHLFVVGVFIVAASLLMVVWLLVIQPLVVLVRPLHQRGRRVAREQADSTSGHER